MPWKPRRKQTPRKPRRKANAEEAKKKANAEEARRKQTLRKPRKANAEEAKRKANAEEAKRANAEEARKKANAEEAKRLDKNPYRSAINKLRKLPNPRKTMYKGRIDRAKTKVELEKIKMDAGRENVRVAAEESAQTMKVVMTNMNKKSLISFINKKRQKLTTPRATVYKSMVAKATSKNDLNKIRTKVENEIINRSL
jgi:hypothetical protein